MISKINSVFFLILHYVLNVLMLFAPLLEILGDGTMRMKVILSKAKIETDLRSVDNTAYKCLVP
jgi:hypothetical protein